MTSTKKDEINRQYIFRAALNPDGSYDVIRRVAGSGQQWTMISYEELKDASTLVEQLQMLEMRRWARLVKQARREG